ncbi:heat shock 70 kDa protein 12B-like isoform X2 [Mya arenaria]|uniref:heat shock 70 kDa protein 12B-like isoform X2 n=1 Tax=Mya arenaria TaxID=6604 RepID=UPI0022E69918|nr:heat shock 70 kDa protein 12B-like isoform X2 [Mya arenaria]
MVESPDNTVTYYIVLLIPHPRDRGVEDNRELLLHIVEQVDGMRADQQKAFNTTLAGPENACAKLNVQNCRNEAEEEAVTETVIQNASKKGVFRTIQSIMQKCMDRLTKFDVISGKLEKLFEPLEDIFRKKFGNDRLQLQFIMTDDQFYDLLSGLLLMLQMAWVYFTTNQQHVRSETPHSNKQQKPTVHMLSSSNVQSRAKGLSSVGSNSKKLIVAAIDIGTSYSGYAYSSIDDFTFNPLKITTSTGQFMYKAPTKILLTPDQAFYAFGFEAENKYVSLAEEEQHKDWFYFEDIKMQLNEKLPAGIRASDLKLGIEAEAGSIYCKTLAVQGTDKKAIDLCKSGCRFVVLDIGGGTVDVTAYEVNTNGTLGEIHSAGGGGWGGNMVNEGYIEMLYRIFGKEIVESYQNDNKGDFLEMQADFEKKKRALNETCTRVYLRLPFSFINVVEEHTSSTVSLLIVKAGFADDIGFKREKLSISGMMFLDFFKPSTEKITSYLQNLLDSADVHNSVDKLILVGGFSQSPVVRNAIQEAFPHIPMYCPEDAELAVLKGAVIFGHTPRVITERISKLSYGIAVMQDAVVGCPEEFLYIASNGKFLMKDVFARFVEKGERVNINQWMVKEFQIVDDKYPLTVVIYASSKKEVTFVHEESCQLLGTLSVGREQGWKEYDDIGIWFSFGYESIQIESHHKRTGKITRLSLDVQF